MRIDKVHIGNFKNLNKVTVDFDEKSLSTVLIGPNGSGKSNLLEAIAIIFRNLDLHEDPKFKYTIDYQIRTHRIGIDADPLRERDKTQIVVDSKVVSFRTFVDHKSDYLPNNVFGYYSGVSKRFQQIFAKHQNQFYTKLINSVEPPLRPLFLARTFHGQYVLLAFFALGDEESVRFLKEYFNITGISSIVFHLKEPYWHMGKGTKSTDGLFWGAEGVVKNFLYDISKISTWSEKKPHRINLSNKRVRREERFDLRIKDLQSLQELARQYGKPVQFFKKLESVSISDLIGKLSITVRKEGADSSIEFGQLSEGEQQLLVVLGLLKFMNEEESLFLLDEPDTHLNPRWKLGYLRMIERVVGTNDKSHIIIVTHDPLLIGGLTKSQVQIFSVSKKYSLLIEPPEVNPIGLGVDGLLTSDIFGLPSTLDIKTQEKLDQRIVLIVKKNLVKEKLTDQEAKVLADLDDYLSKLGFISTVRDPLYSKFLTALRKYELKEKITFDELERKAQADIVEKLLLELKAGVKQ
jgi:predicted ATPase